MKNSILLLALIATTASFAQIWMSFEEPDVFSSEYTDTGDATIAHDLLNNIDEPLVNFTTTGGELGHNASYSPYDTPGDGLTDGDFVGVTEITPTTADPFPDGLQGYQISDVDGNFLLEFDTVDTGVNGVHALTMDYFIADTGFEGDGTVNEPGSDRLRIYVKDLTNSTEIDILDTTGNDINDLAIQGSWISANVDLSGLGGATVQLVIEARTNAGTEAFFFDNIIFQQLTGFDDFNHNLFSLHPNPTTAGYIDIVSANEGTKEVAVYDILGKQVIKTSLATDRLDISELNSGIYVLKIVQGEASATKKLVVK